MRLGLKQAQTSSARFTRKKALDMQLGLILHVGHYTSTAQDVEADISKRITYL